MGTWQKVIILLLVITLGVGFGGYVFYKNYYVKPRTEIADKRAQLQQAIDNGKQSIEQMTSMTTELEPLYTRSFPTNAAEGGLQYEMWLSQMLEFCNIRDAQVTRQQTPNKPNSGTMTQTFLVQAKCSLLDVTQFLYEFYWTPFLHRINSFDVAPVEGSDLLRVTMSIQGLTILYKTNPQQAFPLANKLPLSASAPQQLASGPFAAYKQLGDFDIFRLVRTGVDETTLVILTGVPTITEESGEAVKVSRWRLEADNKTLSLKVGDSMRVGAFEAVIADIDENLVVLRQKNGMLWAVPLGYKLNEAVAVPSNLF